MLEDLHAGTSPSSASGDYSDGTLSSTYGVIPWPKVSRLNDDEMKRLMIDVVERTYRFIHTLIEATRSRVVTAVNNALIDLYWRIGQYISRKIVEEGWGQGTVAALAEYIRARRPNARGFSASNLWRMMQFYETYRGLPKLAPLVRVLSW